MCVTNRNLCQEDFLTRIEKVANKMSLNAIILREKDLVEEQYEQLAKQVLTICEKNKTTCILHNYVNIAMKLSHKKIHLPMSVLRGLSQQERDYFQMLGASCHSVEEAKEAERLGCTYIMAGHIFSTDCKKDLEPRGLGFLQEVCKSVQIPVWAIGGITQNNMEKIIAAGAAGGCIMSGFMK